MDKKVTRNLKFAVDRETHPILWEWIDANPYYWQQYARQLLEREIQAGRLPMQLDETVALAVRKQRRGKGRAAKAALPAEPASERDLTRAANAVLPADDAAGREQTRAALAVLPADGVAEPASSSAAERLAPNAKAAEPGEGDGAAQSSARVPVADPIEAQSVVGEAKPAVNGDRAAKPLDEAAVAPPVGEGGGTQSSTESAVDVGESDAIAPPTESDRLRELARQALLRNEF